MIEIPESHTLARQIAQTLQGRRVAHVTINASPHKFAFFHGDAADYPTLLTGCTVDGARAVAGQVEITLGDIRLTLGDGAYPRLYAAPAAVPARHQLLLRFDDDSALAISTQMYGFISAFRHGENDNPYYLVAREKPTPLTDAFDAAYFDGLFGGLKPNLSVKAFLATEQRIPGLGNGVLQDILFTAGIHPKTKLAALDDADRERLFRSVKGTLAEMTRRGGRDTENDLFGSAGGYRTQLSGKTWKEPCPICGDAIVRQAYLGGNVYVCPACQPVK
ncbi:MAG: endonuclease VIII [Eubacteriales bacterium]|nr:endonuclease VIII [Eubacteriales bacterium]